MKKIFNTHAFALGITLWFTAGCTTIPDQKAAPVADNVFNNVIELHNTGNTYDLSQEAKVIADQIITALEEEKKKGADGKPVVVILPEMHLKPSHILLQQAVMLLLKQYNPILAMEVSSESREFITDMATLTRYSLGATAHHNKIPELFNDCARIQIRSGVWLDQKDKRTRNAVKTYNPALLDKDISLHSPDGFAIRNVCMVSWALAYAQSLDRSLIIQTTGLAHTLGFKSEKAEFQDSLAHQYAKLARVIVATPMDDGSFYTNYTKSEIPTEALEDKNIQKILIHHLPGQNSLYSLSDFLPQPSIKAGNIRAEIYQKFSLRDSTARERKLIKTISQASGMALQTLPALRDSYVSQSEMFIE